MKCILALDQGTTSSRAIVFDGRGDVLGKGQGEFGQSFPEPGWVEHDAEEIWQTQFDAAEAAIDEAGVRAEDIAGIGITNQRETVVVWDRATGEPIAPAIVWQDRRTADFCERNRQAWEDRVRARTGLRLDPYFSGTKLKWLLDEVEGARDRAVAGELAFGTIETWLVWKLTGGGRHVTDVSNASRTLLMDLEALDWDGELLEWLEVPREILPRIVGNSEVVGESDLFGVPIPIAGMAGDQQAALFGQLCFDEGMVKNTYGTGCFLLMQTGGKPVFSNHDLLTTVAWKLPDAPCQYAIEGSVFTGGAVVQWLRDGLGLIEKSSDIDALAAGEPDNGGVYLAPAFTGLGAPHWDPYARGLIAGLTRGSSAGHLARAALESIAFQVDDVVQAMKADTGLGLAEVRVDGGASESDLLMQFQSDLLECDIIRTAISETTARGAAFLAGLATGVWSDLGELQSLWEEARRFEPQGDVDEMAKQRRGWNGAVKRSLHWAREMAIEGGRMAMLEPLISREALLKAASDGAVGWDLIVIGGGATGLATAWDAVSRGLRVALLERSDFSKATSSRSTKLVHGGVRYLQNGEIGLVREALKERKRLLENAPEFARPLRFVLPTTHFLGRYYYRFGMLLYDLLAGKAGIERAELLSEAETRGRLPGIALEGLRGGVAYSDAQFDDAALSVAMAQAICAGGGVALNYVSVENLLMENGRVAGVGAEDVETGELWEMRAKVVINATGIFSDVLRGENSVKPKWSVRTSRGSHLVCPRRVMDGDHGLIIPKTQDGRVLFAIPWKQHVVIGTTDVPTDGPVYDPKPSTEEVGFILEEAGRALGVTAADVTSQWSGLRPLVSRSSTRSTAALSRKHIIEVSPEGLVSVLGGKWTTCRKMGEDAVDAAVEHAGIRAGESATAVRVLTEHGARPPLADLLGESADEFAEDELRARVEEACRFGFARTLEDVLMRRMRVLQLDALAAMRLAPQVAKVMAAELRWTDAELAGQLEAFQRVAQDYLPV